jgi:hypothetical protein
MTTNPESCSRLTNLRVRQVVKEWASQTKRFAETGCSGEGCPVRLENYCAADGTPSEPVGNTLYACTERRIPCAVKNRSTGGNHSLARNQKRREVYVALKRLGDPIVDPTSPSRPTSGVFPRGSHGHCRSAVLFCA